MITAKPLKYNSAYLDGLSFPQAFKFQGSMPGRHKMENGKLMFHCVGVNIDYLNENLEDKIDWSEIPEAVNYLAIQHISEKGIEEKNNVAELAEEIDFEFKLPPFQHQKEAFALSRNKPYFAYLMEMGCGKTKVAIDDIADLYERGKIDGALILAPNGVHSQWVNEQIPDHMPDRIDHVAAVYSSSMKAKEKKHLEATIEAKDKLRIVTANIEALSHKSGLEFCLKFLKTCKKAYAAIDESTRIKVPSSTRTRNCWKLKKHTAIRRILTGSPVTSGIENLYAQLMWLSEDILGISSFTVFKARYCILQQFDNFEKIVGYKMIDDLQRKMDPWVYRVTKEDCLDLPEKIYVTRKVSLTKDQMKLYMEMKERFLVEIDNHINETEFVTAKLPITKLLRLQQITSGFLPSEEQEGQLAWSIDYKKNPKIQETLNILEESQGQTIVWARFKHDLAIIEEALSKKYKVVTYHGGTSKDDRTEAIRKFRSGEADIFLGNPAAAGIGLNLNVAKQVIYYSDSFDAEHRWQSEDRAHRIGIDWNVTYFDIVAENSIDVQIKRVLKERKSLADLTIDQVRDFFI